jgi:hypothetical protein
MDDPLGMDSRDGGGGPIYRAMVDFFEDDNWPYTPVPGEPVLSLHFVGKSGHWICYAQAREEQQQFVFYSVCPMAMPDFKRQAVAEFVTRANYGMIIGNFELDYNDGEVRYKTSLDVEGTELNLALIRQAVYANVLMMDRYLPGLLNLVYTDVTPAQAVAEVEGRQ